MVLKRQIQSNLGKNIKINRQSHVKFWFNIKNLELSHIYLAVLIIRKFWETPFKYLKLIKVRTYVLE